MRTHEVSRRRMRGFTLLEVLLATALLALVLGAVLVLVRDQITHAHTAQVRTLAHWIALDRVHEQRLFGAWPAPGVQRGEVWQAGRRWYWVQTVRPGNLPDTREIVVEVGEQATGPMLARSIGWLVHLP
jgi:general secretion pathway protein I